MKKNTKILILILAGTFLVILGLAMSAKLNKPADVIPTVTPALPTGTPVPAATEAPTDVPEITEVPEITDTPEVTDVPEPSETPEVTETPTVPTGTPEPTDVPTATPTEPLVPTETPAPEPTATPVPTEIPEPTEAPEPTPYIPDDTFTFKDGTTRPLISVNEKGEVYQSNCSALPNADPEDPRIVRSYHDKNGVLYEYWDNGYIYIRGTGAMADWRPMEGPRCEFDLSTMNEEQTAIIKSETYTFEELYGPVTVVVEEGITHFGRNSITGLGMVKIYLPSTLKSLHSLSCSSAYDCEVTGYRNGEKVTFTIPKKDSYRKGSALVSEKLELTLK